MLETEGEGVSSSLLVPGVLKQFFQGQHGHCAAGV